MTEAPDDDNPTTTRSEKYGSCDSNEVAEAAAVDAKVQGILRAARARGPAGPFATLESRDGTRMQTEQKREGAKSTLWFCFRERAD